MSQAALQAGRNTQPARRFDLTLDDAVQRALDRNLDIAVQRINPLVQDMQVATANAAFLPFASSGFGVNQRTTPNRSLFDGGGLRGANIVSEQGNYDLGINQRMKWGGGQYDLSWNSSRFETTKHLQHFQPELRRQHDPPVHANRCCAAFARTRSARSSSCRGSTGTSRTSTWSRPSSIPSPTSVWRTGSSCTPEPRSPCSSRRWSWPSNSCATTARASRSALWPRSTSCRRSRRRRRGGSRWRWRSGPCGPTSWR